MTMEEDALPPPIKLTPKEAREFEAFMGYIELGMCPQCKGKLTDIDEKTWKCETCIVEISFDRPKGKIL